MDDSGGEKGHLIVELLSPSVDMKKAAPEAIRQESEEVFKGDIPLNVVESENAFFYRCIYLGWEVILRQHLVSAEHFHLLRPGRMSNCTSTPPHSVNTHHWQTALALNSLSARSLK